MLTAGTTEVSRRRVDVAPTIAGESKICKLKQIRVVGHFMDFLWEQPALLRHFPGDFAAPSAVSTNCINNINALGK